MGCPARLRTSRVSSAAPALQAAGRLRAGIVLAGLAGALAMGSGPLAAHAEDPDPVVARAVAHLLAVERPDGLFEYDFDFARGAASGDDHLVRQALTVWVLAERLDASSDPRVAGAVARGLGALSARTLAIERSPAQVWAERAGLLAPESWTLGRWLGRLGLLYRPGGAGGVVADHGAYREAYAGATALALLAEHRYAQATGDARFADMRARWLGGLDVLRVPGRGVRHDPTQLEESPFYDGEAWLAIAVHAGAHPGDARARRLLLGLEVHLLHRYGRRLDRRFVSWGLMAARERAAQGAARRMLPFVARQVEMVLAEIPPELTQDHNPCALVEGLAAALDALHAHGDRPRLAAALRRRIALELERARALQIGPGQTRLERKDGPPIEGTVVGARAGAFLLAPGRPYTRIDTTDHCIGAFAMARRLGIPGRVGGPHGATAQEPPSS